MPYKCLILGDFPRGDKYTARSCFQFIMPKFVEEFKKLGVETSFTTIYDNRTDVETIRAMSDYMKNDHFRPMIRRIGCADLVIYVDWDRSDVFPMDKVRKKTSAKYVFGFNCFPFNFLDWNFTFTKIGDDSKRTFIELPCDKSAYEIVPKKKKIIIDHDWEDKQVESWTSRISDWLESVSDVYCISKMIRFDWEMDFLKNHEKFIPHLDVYNYLKMTEDTETFIVSHKESYGFGVIDMVARGIRVTAPRGFLNPEMVDKLQIKEFSNKEELLEIVNSPVEEHWATDIDKFTDYSEVVRLMDEKYKELCVAS